MASITTIFATLMRFYSYTVYFLIDVHFAEVKPSSKQFSLGLNAVINTSSLMPYVQINKVSKHFKRCCT